MHQSSISVYVIRYFTQQSLTTTSKKNMSDREDSRQKKRSKAKPEESKKPAVVDADDAEKPESSMKRGRQSATDAKQMLLCPVQASYPISESVAVGSQFCDIRSEVAGELGINQGRFDSIPYLQQLPVFGAENANELEEETNRVLQVFLDEYNLSRPIESTVTDYEDCEHVKPEPIANLPCRQDGGFGHNGSPTPQVSVTRSGSVGAAACLMGAPSSWLMPNFGQAVPPNMQHAQQMHMQHQQGAAAARHTQQLDLRQQQMFPQARNMQQQAAVARPKNSFERIMLRINGFFPNYNKVQLTGFLIEVQTSNNGSLSGLSVNEIISRVSDLVQRQWENSGNASQRMQSKGFVNQQGMIGSRPTAPPTTMQSQCPTTYQPAPTPAQSAWTMVGGAQRGINWHKELVDGEEEEEDPCVICFDEMSGDNILEIQCGHIFHSHCIQEWLKQQNTCPTCRNYTILKDDYPSLHK